MTDDGWRPLTKPATENAGSAGFIVTPFVRLARVQAVNSACDAAVTVALAGSIFFSISPDESRGRVALYLLLTMAPFAVVTPLIGPAIDRFKGGRRMMIIATMAGRMILAFLISQHSDSLLLFPEAFGFLIFQKSYTVAKSALVPRLVKSDADLVDANSRLALIAALASVVGAVLGGFVSLIGGPAASAGLGMLGFIGATVLAIQMKPVVVAAEPADEEERAELRDAPIVLAGSATAILRGVVGFVTFLLAFEFRGGEDGLDVGAEGAAVGGATATARGIDITGDPAAPIWHFGVVLFVAAVGALAGAKVAPMLRKRFVEERMLQGVLIALVACALFAALANNLFGAAVLSLAVATGAAAGKLAFDAIVQRDAPDANYGRSFARFEARFQIAWVVGAFFPAVFPINLALGSMVVAIAAGFALLSYLLGRPWLRGAAAHALARAQAAQDRRAGTDSTVGQWVSGGKPEAGSPPAESGERHDDRAAPLPTRESVEASTPSPSHELDVMGPSWDAHAPPFVSSVDGVVFDDGVFDDGVSDSSGAVDPPARPDDDESG